MYNDKMFNLDPMSAVNCDVAKQHYVELSDLKNLHIPLI